MIGIFVLLISVFISKFLLQKANGLLEVIKKAELIDLFSKDSLINFGILLILLGLFFISIKFNLTNPTISYAFFMISLLIFISVINIRAYKKLESNNYPQHYIRTYIVSGIIRFLGLIVFAVLMISSRTGDFS
jgi:hypothetical protein